MTSVPSLRRIYRAMNQKYWDGQLPDVDVYWEPCGDKDGMVTREVHPATEGEPAELEIIVDPSLKLFPNALRLKMGHEQVHVFTWQLRKLADHGDVFDREIRRLCGYKSFRKLI